MFDNHSALASLWHTAAYWVARARDAESSSANVPRDSAFAETYDEVLDLAENGDAGTVDMLVKDIYGGDCKLISFQIGVICFPLLTVIAVNLCRWQYAERIHGCFIVRKVGNEGKSSGKCTS